MHSMADLNRSFIVTACNNRIKGTLEGTAIAIIITAYCKEFKKPQTQSLQMLSLLLQRQLPIHWYYTALEYYMRKYSIIQVQKINKLTGEIIPVSHH